MNCQKVATRLMEYLDCEVDDLCAKEIEEHLDTCRKCFDMKEFERLLRDKMRRATNHTCPSKLKKRIEDLIQRF